MKRHPLYLGRRLYLSTMSPKMHSSSQPCSPSPTRKEEDTTLALSSSLHNHLQAFELASDKFIESAQHTDGNRPILHALMPICA